MLKLKSPNSVPPGGYYYFVEQTGFRIEAGDIDDLIIKVTSHLMVNHLTMELPDGVSLKDYLIDWLCRRIPSSLCYAEERRNTQIVCKTKPHPAVVSVAPQLGRNVLDRTIVLAHRAARQFNGFVPNALAEERALRMLECPYMRPARVCYSCSHIGPVDQAMGRELRTSLDSRLQVCGKLGAYARAVVHMDISILAPLFKGIEPGQLDEKFWLYPELQSQGVI